MLKSSKLLKKHISKNLFSSHLQNIEKYEMILKQWIYCIHIYILSPISLYVCIYRYIYKIYMENIL